MSRDIIRDGWLQNRNDIQTRSHDEVEILRFLERNETAAPRGPRPNRETMTLIARGPGRPQS